MRKRGREGREGGRRVHLQLDPTLLDMYCCTCSFMFAPVVSCIAAALGPSQCVARLGSPRAWAALLSGRAGEGEHVGGAVAGRMIYDYMHLAMLQHCLNSPLLQQQVHGADHIRCSALQRNLYMCVDERLRGCYLWFEPFRCSGRQHLPTSSCINMYYLIANILVIISSSLRLQQQHEASLPRRL